MLYVERALLDAGIAIQEFDLQRRESTTVFRL